MIGPFFYDPRQSVPGLDSFSPSAGKPARFMALADHHYRTTPVLPVIPVTREDLCLVHDRDYVDGVFAGTIDNGFGNRDPRVPESCLWTVGSLVTAALYAPTTPLAVCSPTSGFHHAGYAHGGGYCTFNGLMVAAAKFIQAHPGAKVGILDCDFHYGDGTADILRRKPELAKHVVHHTSGKTLPTRAMTLTSSSCGSKSPSRTSMPRAATSRCTRPAPTCTSRTRWAACSTTPR